MGGQTNKKNQPTTAITITTLKKKLIGNWVANTDLYSIETGDTIHFEKTKYNYDLYTWGKYPSGIEFKSDQPAKTNICASYEL